MKALLIDREDVEYMKRHFKESNVMSAVIPLKEMKPNKNTLRIVRGYK